MSPGGRPRQQRKKPSKLGAAITRARGDISQAEVARRAGLSTTYLSALEAGERKNPGLPLLQRLAKALGVPVEKLLGAEADLQRARTLIARRRARLLRTMTDRQSRAVIQEVFGQALEVLDSITEHSTPPAMARRRSPKGKP